MQRLALPSRESGLRLADVVGALSLATDFGLGQPFEHALQSAIVAMRLGEVRALSDESAHPLLCLAAPLRRLHRLGTRDRRRFGGRDRLRRALLFGQLPQPA